MPLAAYLIPAKENAEDPAYKTVLWNFSSFACKIESDSELLATLERGGIVNLFAKDAESV